MGCLDDDVMDYIDEALGINVGLQDSASDKDTLEQPAEDVPDELVLTLCSNCLKQFIYSLKHKVPK